jgi:phenylacetate-CoA ligase
LNLKAVILTGEMVFPRQVEVIKSAFGSAVTEEYGCSEVGPIGFRCPNGNMHLMENLLVEQSDDPCSELPGELFVTELYGRLFPFIRYRLGDRGTIACRQCKCGRTLPLLDSLHGRADDLIRCPNGSLVDPVLIEYIIKDMPQRYGAIHQFRIVQRTLDSIHLSATAKGNHDKIRSYISHKLSEKLPEQLLVNIQFLSTIMKEESGKLRCFKSEIA